ncbi:glycosyltransferase family 29 protein [Devosia sp.]|uniref:glycosyltransferase family 29 protein n=1 Tax=Devosia sp. TaxID=1871048 RepID=UPI003BAD303C
MTKPLLQGLQRVLIHARYPTAIKKTRSEEFAEASMAHLRPLIDGKVVAAVGNAQSIFGSGLGPDIDACDTVLRFNLGFIRQPEDQGSRSDIVGVSGRLSPKSIYAGFPGARVWWLTARREMMGSGFLRRIDEIAITPRDSYTRLRQALGSNPSSGLIALAALLELFTPTKVIVFGFDWKQTPTFYPAKTGHHNWQGEREMVARLAAEGRVELRTA